MSYRGYQQGGGSSTPYRSNVIPNLNQRNMVSPWECGVAPNSRGQVQNIIPLNQSPTNTNMMAQQHALAVASNLLSTLGMLPQHQQQHQQLQQQSRELPSLLNMSGLGNSPFPYRQQQQSYGRGSLNNRMGNNTGMMRRKQEQGNYRSEPYNKQNRGRLSGPVSAGQQGRGRNAQFSKNYSKPGGAARANSKTPVSSKGLPDLRLKLKKPVKGQGESGGAAESGKDEADAQDPEAQTKSSEKEEEAQPVSDIPLEEESKREDDDDAAIGKKKKKRDWKDEKKVDIVVLDDESKEPDEDAAIKSPLKGDVEKNKVAETEKKEPRNPNKIFECHVCKRNSHGEMAFVRHLNSKPHKIAMETLSEQYKLEADNQRRNMQVDVRLLELNYEKQKRLGKIVRTDFNREYCKMCDLNFFGTLPAHRRNEKHLKLKAFLHPRCRTCDKEFPTRLEWDNHRLSILHQLRLDAKTEKVNDSSAEGVKSILEASDEGQELMSATPAYKGDDGDTEYDPNAFYGMEVIIPGLHCRVCGVFFQKKRDHCKTRAHFDNYMQYKAKEKEAAEIAIKSKETEELAEPEATNTDPETLTVKTEPVAEDELVSKNDDDEGNWKRRRVETVNDEEDDDSVVELSPIKKDVLTVKIQDTPPKTIDGDDPYDPLEADTESQDENGKVLPVNDDILEELDEAINDILDSAKPEPDVEKEVEEVVPVRGARARRGVRGGGPRGRKRK